MAQFKIGDKAVPITPITSKNLEWARISEAVDELPKVFTIAEIREDDDWENSYTGSLRFEEVLFDWPIWWFKPVKENSMGVKESDGKLMVEELYWPFIEDMAKVMTINKKKYPPKNHLKKMDKEQLLGAAQRHMIEIWKGNETDVDGTSHITKVATNMMLYYIQTQLHKND